ncbi:hypothetical protein [Brucella pseudogrignonensis]|uniref:Exonuclease n=1 Tax=Ochrobactrum phage POA1180 TaxID=1897640 RepID=A0A219VHE7_9CAUD|nr:hypothetical protein [Brucella pseudogrignonensis]YP_010665137.1 Rz-like spanin [Ochrobactrum phage POA1180]AOT25362.1 exonuclease [Ochrobactrum phage POA1180]KAB2691994.1 hypothetical protein F9K82_08780 [Brucella pseudogrignonensis]
MIGIISAWFGKRASPLLIFALLLFFAMLLTFGAVRSFRGIISDAVTVAEKARDAYWSEQIAKANEVAAKNIIEQMKAAQAAQEKAQAEIIRLNNKVYELEDANAALSDTAGSGIDVDRSRLLNNQFLGGRADPPY